MSTTLGLSSAAGIVALLSEPQDELKVYGLQKLDAVVDVFWPEIADSISQIEALYESQSFKSRELAALVASKVHYHLEDRANALTYALGAGNLFNVNLKTEYVENLIAAAIDEYVRIRVEESISKTGQPTKIDPRLESIVERMFERCFVDGEFKQVIGIGLESWRTDMVEKAILKSPDAPGMLQYCYDLCMNVVQHRDFRHTILRILVNLYRTSCAVPDYINMCHCLIYLNDAVAVSEILEQLLRGDDDQQLIALQIAFDLSDNSPQEFLLNVRKKLETTPMDTGSAPGGESVTLRNQLKEILSGSPLIQHFLEFLYRNNKADALMLKTTKEAVNERNSVLHSAIVFSNSLMHAGTTIDTFLRENIDWLSRATNWAKFSATASLGVIHKGQAAEALNILAPYLPQAGGGGVSPYTEGGSLYALGIINANHGEGVARYLLDALRSTQNETVQHGACLGLGMAAMATGNEEIYEALREVLYSDSAVSGEAAAIAAGLVLLGSASEKVEDMLRYARETQHEKIIRGIAVAISLIMYGREEGADVIIDDLLGDKDPILRYGAMYTIALAYAGTASNKAIRKLLHVAVSDVSDDVRRAAVLALGFLLFKQPQQCPKVVALLAESYNPHVRYGAAMALGVSCAGTGMKEALDLLTPMFTDASDFVRQGALLATAMILIQHNEVQEPRVKEMREKYASVLGDKLEDVTTKFGAILSQGILDAGGRNVTISLTSRSGHKNMSAVVGLAVFTQFWYWYPYIHFLSLAFMPTAVIGLDKAMRMPKFTYKSNARPSLFAYPPPTKVPEKVAATKVETAVLSTTAKQAKKTAGKKGDDAKPMEGVEATTPAAATTTTTDVEMKDASAAAAAPAAPAVPEATSELLENPARVTPSQLRHLSFEVDPRYVPIKLLQSNAQVPFGIVLLKDRTPGAPVEVVVPKAPTVAGAAAEEAEPAPPAPFEYTE